MPTARIYQRIKSSMQSGKAQVGSWVLEHEPTEAKRADPLTGWAGSGDTNGQIRLTFPTLDKAVEYARAQGMAYHVVPAGEKVLKIQAYADNFSGVAID
ncbi:ETC complex I subunit [Sphingomonas sp. ID0503]|uniref:ETC complex I subunit n=1 Tax=Sphingomonas sp. ID0503 TaxID=3399691 RepID=UPI003AFB154B